MVIVWQHNNNAETQWGTHHHVLVIAGAHHELRAGRRSATCAKRAFSNSCNSVFSHTPRGAEKAPVVIVISCMRSTVTPPSSFPHFHPCHLFGSATWSNRFSQSTPCTHCKNLFLEPVCTAISFSCVEAATENQSQAREVLDGEPATHFSRHIIAFGVLLT